MNCRTVQSRLTAWLDGELSANTAARMQAHLDTCPACTQVWKEHRALRRLTAAWTIEGGEVWEAVRQQIEPDAFETLQSEVRQMLSEIKALKAEVVALRAQVAARPAEEARQPSPLLPYAQPPASSHILM